MVVNQLRPIEKSTYNKEARKFGKNLLINMQLITGNLHACFLTQKVQ